MTLPDVFFLASVLFVLFLCGRIAASALRRRWDTVRRTGRWLGLFLASYAVALICAALLLPRRYYAPGQRRCFDDWCVTALEVKAVDLPGNTSCPAGPGGRNWVVAVEVSSIARRVRQRARDARAELEDREGKRYQPCAPPVRLLSDELGPGESFRVLLPFRLPGGAEPAGLVLHHGDFPGIAIIGADQSLLHQPALQRLAVDSPH